VVVVDREQGGKDNLEKQGYELRALTTVSALAEALFRSQKITKEQTTNILSYTKRAAD